MIFLVTLLDERGRVVILLRVGFYLPKISQKVNKGYILATHAIAFFYDCRFTVTVSDYSN